MAKPTRNDDLHLRTLWITWGLATLAATFLSFAIFFNERDQRLSAADEQLRIETAYLSHVLETELSNGDYDQAKHQVEAWGRLNEAISFVQLIADNGFVLADFRRTADHIRKHQQTQEIQYSYRSRATLLVEQSLEQVYDAITMLGWQFLGALMVIELIVFALLHQFSRYRHQVRRTEEEYERRLEAQHALERMATLDSLTDLPNRYMLDEQLSLRVAEAKRFERRLALLFIDIDNFKTINDSFGHETGDSLLKTVADRMMTCLRGYDLLARFGGDEFVLLLANIEDIAEIEHVASKINQAFTPRINIEGRELFASASIGISLFPDDASTPGDLLRTADAAMYTAKEAGRNCHRFFTPSMNASLAHRHEIESGLHTALEAGDLYLVYQPQVEIDSGRIIGCEALIRWQSGDHQIPPGEFIPIAEQSALMKQIQAFVIDEAARQRAAWLHQGFADLRVDVNVSGGKLVISNLFDEINDALSRHGLLHAHIGIELTEHTLIEASDDLIASLSRLREMGLSVSLDDFGTGYSSLAYLKTLPVDVLKIDRTFVRDLPHGRMDSAIVKAVIAMGRSMGKKTVAEGVETQTQLDFLQTAGCDVAQGFLLHHPMPAADLTNLLQNRAADPALSHRAN